MLTYQFHADLNKSVQKRDMFILNNVFKFAYMKRDSKSFILH